VISFGVLFIPLDAQQLAAYGYGSIFLITLLGALSIFIPGPTMVAAFVIGSVLNPLIVSLVAGLGSAIGETTGYTVGYASRVWIQEKDDNNAWYWKIFRWMTTRPFLTIFILAAIPNFLTDLSGLIAGRIEYSYPKFLLATFLGKTIRFGLSAYLGANFGGFFLRH
jgi:membrane protein YqaA with SNARE-associated domain